MLTSAVTYLRMVFVLLGAGVALAFATLGITVVAMLAEGGALPLGALVVLAALIVAVPIAGLGLIPGVREIEAVAAQTLLQVGFPRGAASLAAGADRRRGRRRSRPR